MKRKEREFEFIVVETVTYRLRAKGATGREGGGARGPDVGAGTLALLRGGLGSRSPMRLAGERDRLCLGSCDRVQPRYGTGGAISQAVTFHGHVRCFLQ